MKPYKRLIIFPSRHNYIVNCNNIKKNSNPLKLQTSASKGIKKNTKKKHQMLGEEEMIKNQRYYEIDTPIL